MTNILYISYDGMTDPLGQSQVLPYLVGLAAKGYTITLLSCEKSERMMHKDIVQTICSKHHINWQPIAYTRNPPILSTLKDVKRLKKMALALHKNISFDIVHCRSYIAALVGMELKTKQQVPFVFDMRGFWADERVDGGLWNLKNPLFSRVYHYFKKKEVKFLQHADAVISLTYAAKDEIETWGLQHAPISVIPCCVDTDLFNPENLNAELRANLKRKADLPAHKMVMGYIGSLGTWYLLEEMLSFFKFWLQQHPETVLFFVTGESKELIYSAAQKLQLDIEKIRLITASRAEMPYYISLMDFGLFFIKNTYSKKASSPVKQGELMAMGVPVFCNAGVGDSDLIIQKYQSGELIYSYDDQGFEDALRRIKAEMSHPAAIRNGAIDYFDLQKGIEAYATVYDDILKHD